MKAVYLVGAGGFGREMLNWLRQHPDCDTLWQPAGFLDDNLHGLDGFPIDLPIVGSIRDFHPGPDDLLVCAIGQPSIKKKVCSELLARGGKFMTFIHPSATVGARVQMGEGSVICPGVVLTADQKLGAFTLFNCLSSAGHDVCLGDWCTISGHCDLTGFCQLGEGVFLGSGARVLPGVTVGDWARLGAGCVVVRPVAAGLTVFGNPARPL